MLAKQGPSKKALLTAAKALRDLARRSSLESQLYESGIHTGPLKNAHTEHTRLIRYAAELEAAGRGATTGETEKDKVTTNGD